MKRITILLFFAIVFINNCKSQDIDWDAVIDQYVEKYQPEEIPDWLFPIIFKDATESFDTIYLGYDENASLVFLVDTIFSESYVQSKDSVFQAFWAKCPSTICDTLELLDVNILGGNNSESISVPIDFLYSQLPVTMYFDATFLKDNALPFEETPDNPDNQINLNYDNPIVIYDSANQICNTGDVILTDTALIGFPYDYCNFSDSIVFYSEDNTIDWMTNLSLKIVPWTGAIPGSSSISEVVLEYKLGPNPADEKLLIEFGKNISGTVMLFDLLGYLIQSFRINYQNQFEINTTNIPTGIYMFCIKYDGHLIVNKLIIQHE